MIQPFDLETLLLDDSFIQYCLGRADEATIRRWDAISNENPDTVAQAKEIVQSIYNWGSNEELNLSTEALRRQINQPARIYRIIKRVSVAAAVLLAAGITYKRLQPASMITLSTAGSVKKIILPDSSVIWMNTKTTIQYAGRKIILKEGEIFCEVQHDVNHPFTVTTATGLKIADIGTSFQVRSYQALNEENVSVSSGIVMVKNQLLHQGEGMSVNKSTKQATLIPAEDVSWMQQKFILNNVPLSQLLQSLQEQFHVHFITKQGNILKCRVTISFTTSDKISDILDNLKLIYGITYKIQQDEIILDGKGCY
jgi:ferric-dicitrate binding protein FerR (iron transport regulator)